MAHAGQRMPADLPSVRVFQAHCLCSPNNKDSLNNGGASVAVHLVEFPHIHIYDCFVAAAVDALAGAHLFLLIVMQKAQTVRLCCSNNLYILVSMADDLDCTQNHLLDSDDERVRAVLR